MLYLGTLGMGEWGHHGPAAWPDQLLAPATGRAIVLELWSGNLAGPVLGLANWSDHFLAGRAGIKNFPRSYPLPHS